MSHFKPPMSWMKQVFTENQLKKINKDVDKLIDDDEKEGKKVDHHRQEVLRDKVIVKKHNAELDLPFKLTNKGGVLKHLKKINKNLFIVYPFYFEGDQLSSLEKSTQETGFNIRVDTYASRGVGVNLRVIIWKPIKKMLKSE